MLFIYFVSVICIKLFEIMLFVIGVFIIYIFWSPFFILTVFSLVRTVKFESLVEVSDESLVNGVPWVDFLQMHWIDLNWIQYDWFYLVVVLFHYILISETLFNLFNALHVGINDLTLLITVTEWHVITPFNKMEGQKKVKDKEWVRKVYESVTNTALSFQIHGEIKVIVLASEVSVYKLKHIMLQKLYWYVLYHESC